MSKKYDESNYINDIFLTDAPKNHMIVFYDQRIKKGKSVTHVLVDCPICHEKRWVPKTNIDNGHTKSTYCFSHKNLWQIHWAAPGDFDNRKNVLVDYTQQKASESAVNSGKRVVFILGTCPSCAKSRWVRITCLRGGNSTLCMSCAKKNAPHTKSKGGITTANGYTYIHIDTLSERYSPEEVAMITSNLRSSRDRYYPEHRVVALIKYGPLFFSTKNEVVARHINGDKRDNRPENIILGTQRDNVNDHLADRILAKKWQGIAINLAKMLQIVLLKN